MGYCEHGDELIGYTRGGELFDWLSDYQLLKKQLVLRYFFVSGKRGVSQQVE
jgi:hypothetical protein